MHTIMITDLQIKKYRIPVLALLFSLSCMIQGCKPQEDAVTPGDESNAVLNENLTGGNKRSWKITGMQINGSSTTLDACEQDATLEFRSGGVGMLSYANAACGSDHSFSWTTRGDTLFIDLASENQKLLVYEASREACKYRINYDNTLEYNFVLSAQ